MSSKWSRRFAARKDANHTAIATALAQCGLLVHDTSGVGKGFPDLVVYDGRTIRLVEVKTDAGTARPSQVQFHALGWPVFLVRSSAEAIQAATAWRRSSGR